MAADLWMPGMCKDFWLKWSCQNDLHSRSLCASIFQVAVEPLDRQLSCCCLSQVWTSSVFSQSDSSKYVLHACPHDLSCEQLQAQWQTFHLGSFCCNCRICSPSICFSGVWKQYCSIDTSRVLILADHTQIFVDKPRECLQFKACKVQKKCLHASWYWNAWSNMKQWQQKYLLPLWHNAYSVRLVLCCSGVSSSVSSSSSPSWASSSKTTSLSATKSSSSSPSSRSNFEASCRISP